MNNKDTFNNSEEYSDGKYKVFSISNGDKHFRRITCESNGICILPFDLTDDDQVKNVYLAKYRDYLTNDYGHTCITIDFDEDKYDSVFEAVHDCVKNDLGIDIGVNDLFFFGKINHTLPFSKQYKCFGLNLTNYAKDPTGFTLDLPDSEMESKMYTLDKVRFNRVVKGDVDDSLSLSCAMLLLSYIN